MKTQTALKSGLMPLKVCRDVEYESHDRNGQEGNKVYATCPFHGLWAPVSGWFPITKNVMWDENAAKLTGIAKKEDLFM